MTQDETEKWVRGLIATGRVHLFYTSRPWRHTADEARARQHNECQACKEQGRYSPAEVVHHVKELRRYPRLALAQSNLVCLCAACHWEAHHSRRQANEERW